MFLHLWLIIIYNNGGLIIKLPLSNSRNLKKYYPHAIINKIAKTFTFPIIYQSNTSINIPMDTHIGIIINLIQVTNVTESQMYNKVY